MSTNLYESTPYSHSFTQPQPAPAGGLLPVALVAVGAMLVLGAAGAGIVLCLGGDWMLSDAERERRDLIETIELTWGLPAHEEAAVIAQVNRIFDAHTSGQITYEQCEGIFTELMKTPHFAILSARDFDEFYVPDADLRGPARRAATRTIERALRGLLREQISRDDFYAAMPAIYSFDDRFTEQELDEMSDEEYDELLAEEPDPTPAQIRESLVKLQALADHAGIPDEPFHADFAL
ncbi:MAG TPA: hypothetical protein VFV87_12335, partial [Pirellulaceae bacterium]|nr:hypothetical protein [Pirellulaceae bacterium]